MQVERCKNCGSPNVEYAVWASPNANSIGEPFGSPGESDTEFCNHCEQHGAGIDLGHIDQHVLATRVVNKLPDHEVRAMLMMALAKRYTRDFDRLCSDYAANPDLEFPHYKE